MKIITVIHLNSPCKWRRRRLQNSSTIHDSWISDGRVHATTSFHRTLL